MASKQNLLMFGATGYIGTHIIQQIVASKSSFRRIAVFTSNNTADKKTAVLDSLKEEGVEVIVGNASNPNDITKALEGVNTVISAVGRNAILEQIEWIRLAEQSESVTRFFPSEFGTDIEYGPESANEKPHQLKLKVRAALKESKNLEYTFLVTGPYAEAVMRAAPNPAAGSFDVKAKKAYLLGEGTGKISLTTKDDVGRLTVKALLHPNASRNRALRVNSFTTTESEILAEFEKHTGSKWSSEKISLKDLRASEEKAWAIGNGTSFTLRRIWATGGTLYEKRDNGLIDGEETETLQDAVQAAVTSQLAGTKGGQ